jgi:hypothetical protein
MNQTRRLAAILAADVAGYVISTYECSQFRTEFAADSPLEEDGFELVVPLSKRTAVPSSPFGFPVDVTGYERSNLPKRRFRVPGS